MTPETPNQPIPGENQAPVYRTPQEVIIAGHQRLAALYGTIVEIASTRDQLTGLLNKSAWEADIAERIENNMPFGTVFIDLNAFKLVNDVLGHRSGDILLQNFSITLLEKFKRKDDKVTHSRFFIDEQPSETTRQNIVSRWAGDEFALTFGVGTDDKRGMDKTTGRHKTEQERFEDQVSYIREVFDEFVASQPDEIKALNFDIAFGPVLWSPESQLTSKELIKQVDDLMYANKTAMKRSAREALPRRKRFADWIGQKLLHYAGTPKSR